MTSLMDEDTDEHPTEKSRKINIGHVGVVAALMTQFAMLVWQASKMSASVETVNATLARMDERQTEFDQRQRTAEIKAAEQAGYNAALKEMIFKLQEERRR